MWKLLQLQEEIIAAKNENELLRKEYEAARKVRTQVLSRIACRKQYKELLFSTVCDLRKQIFVERRLVEQKKKEQDAVISRYVDMLNVCFSGKFNLIVMEVKADQQKIRCARQEYIKLWEESIVSKSNTEDSMYNVHKLRQKSLQERKSFLQNGIDNKKRLIDKLITEIKKSENERMSDFTKPICFFPSSLKSCLNISKIEECVSEESEQSAADLTVKTVSSPIPVLILKDKVIKSTNLESNFVKARNYSEGNIILSRTECDRLNSVSDKPREPVVRDSMIPLRGSKLPETCGKFSVKRKMKKFNNDEGSVDRKIMKTNKAICSKNKVRNELNEKKNYSDPMTYNTTYVNKNRKDLYEFWGSGYNVILTSNLNASNEEKRNGIHTQKTFNTCKSTKSISACEIDNDNNNKPDVLIIEREIVCDPEQKDFEEIRSSSQSNCTTDYSETDPLNECDTILETRPVIVNNENNKIVKFDFYKECSFLSEYCEKISLINKSGLPGKSCNGSLMDKYESNVNVCCNPVPKLFPRMSVISFKKRSNELLNLSSLSGSNETNRVEKENDSITERENNSCKSDIEMDNSKNNNSIFLDPKEKTIQDHFTYRDLYAIGGSNRVTGCSFACCQYMDNMIRCFSASGKGYSPIKNFNVTETEGNWRQTEEEWSYDLSYFASVTESVLNDDFASSNSCSSQS